MIHTLLKSFLAASLIALTACQTTDSGSFSSIQMDEFRDLAVALERFDVVLGPSAHNIPLFPLETWYHISDIYLFISDGREGNFLVTFDFPCRGIETAVNLGVGMSGPLMNPGDYIFPVSISGDLGTGCRIEEINSVVSRLGKEE